MVNLDCVSKKRVSFKKQSKVKNYVKGVKNVGKNKVYKQQVKKELIGLTYIQLFIDNSWIKININC